MIGIKIFLAGLLCLFFTNTLHSQNTIDTTGTILKFRTIERRLSTALQPHIYLFNIGRTFKIRKWDRPEIKIVARVAAKNISQYNDAQLFEAIDVFFDDRDVETKILSFKGTTVLADNYFSGSNRRANANKKQDIAMGTITQLKSQKKLLISDIVEDTGCELFVPAAIKLEIDNTYGKITLEDDFEAARLLLNTSTLAGKNIASLSMMSSFSEVQLENIKDATLDLNNDQFAAHNINHLNIGSTSSTIHYRDGQTLNLFSRKDKIFSGVIKQVEGFMQFGELKILQLQNSISIGGEYANIYLQDIAADVKSIYLKDAWANVRLPLSRIGDYKLRFTGYATVFAPFPVKFLKSASAPNELGKRYFNYNKNLTSSKVAIEINCPKCTVDFN